MREQLVRYIDLLFAGAADAEEIKEEILQNTLDRYDDLIAQGKSPEAAYRLAISGIGDINEILGGRPSPSPAAPAPTPEPARPWWKELCRILSLFFYVLCPIPLLLIQDEWGLCLLLAMVAVGVALGALGGSHSPEDNRQESEYSPQESLRRSIRALAWVAAAGIYLLLSFATHAWWITWMVFPITACMIQMRIAVRDQQEQRADKANTVTRQIIYGFLIFLLVGALVFSLLWFGGESPWRSFHGFSALQGGITSSSGEVSAQSIQELEIDWPVGNVEIAPGDTACIQFREDGAFSPEEAMVWKQDGEKLRIRYQKSWNTSTSGSKDLTILVPRDWGCEKIDVESASANISVQGITAQTWDLANVSGRTELRQCRGQEVEFSNVSGVSSFDGSFQELTFETVSGDVILTIPADLGFTAKMTSVSGKVSTGFPVTLSGNEYISGDGSAEIYGSSVSGNLSINPAA